MGLNLASRTMPEGEEVPPLAPISSAELARLFPQYEILECLGRGGMGVVYKARQRALDRMVAIKLLAGEWQDDPQFAARFEQEAKVLAQMNHPNIVTIHDFGEVGGRYYIVMEYVDGVNLRDLMEDGRMEAKQALTIVPAVCEALEYAHAKGVVHRDIKPENILLDREGWVKLADFGIASLAGTSGEKAGTPAYMAPEQREGQADQRADVYALGVVLYEMLTGERPGQDLITPLRRVRVDINIDEVVLRALEKEPARRYQTVDELHTVLGMVVAATPAVDQAESEPTKKRRKKRRKKVVLRLFENTPPRSSLLAMAVACLVALALIMLAVNSTWPLLESGNLSEMVENPEPGSWVDVLDGSASMRMAAGGSIALVVALAFWLTFVLGRRVFASMDHG